MEQSPQRWAVARNIGDRKNNSRGRTRTCDKTVNSRLLYQLSYAGLEKQPIKMARAGRRVNLESRHLRPDRVPEASRADNCHGSSLCNLQEVSVSRYEETGPPCHGFFQNRDIVRVT